MAKFLFTADIHADKSRIKDVKKLFERIKEAAVENKADCLIIGGDLWNIPVSNTRVSGFTDVMAAIKDLEETVDIIDITGTPSHESSGSTLFIEALGGKVFEKPSCYDYKGVKLLLIPELRRSDFISNSAQKTTSLMNEELKEICKNKADVICFHGEISGALMDNGTAAKSDVQLTGDMIRSTGAKLTLAGHIHTPQSLNNNAYYVGSPVPCNFGETHEGSIIFFEVTDGEIKSFKRISMGFPKNRTVECDLQLLQKLYKMNFTNVNVKVKLSLTTEERTCFHIKDETEKIKTLTGAKSVTMSINTIKETTVRSREITKTTSLVEKLKIYCNVNKINLTPDILEKAQDFENKLLIQYTYPSHSMELTSISLRGAKGLTGREQIEIDFTQYEDGVLAIIGSNGAGKSTLLENCSPYPCLLTRSGSLRSHFYLKDSHRIVTYKDENGVLYKFTITLAAHIENGLVKYFAETSNDNGLTWIKVDGVDGNLDSYKSYVDSVFGSIAQYLRTAFFTTEKTKGYSDIATAGKTEKMELISELLGVESLSNMHDMIKEELKKTKGEFEKYEGFDEKKKELKSDLNQKTETLGFYNESLKDDEEKLSEIEEEIKQNKKDEEYYNEYFSKYGQKIQLKSEAEDNLIELQEHLDNLVKHKSKNDFFKNFTNEINEYKKTKEDFKPVQDKFNITSKKLNETITELFDTSTKMNDAKRKCEIEQNKLNNVDERIKNIKEEAVEITDRCPVCGSKLSEKKKKELFMTNSHIEEEIKSLEEFKVKQKEFISAAKKEYSSFKSKVDRLKEREKTLHKDFDELDEKYQATKAYLEFNEKYEDYVTYTPVDNLEKDIEGIKKEISRTKEFLNTIGDFEIIDYKAKAEELEEKRKEVEGSRLNNSVNIASLKTQIETINQSLEEIERKKGEVDKILKEISDYSILEKAFSNTGIQALELEAAAPNIAELTNLILLDSYGDKFSVSFSTLEQKKDKLVDDFTINVTNHETGWTTPIELLSKGEKVWITEALYYAFSIIRMERTNFSFNVRFVDESDGGLDSDVRLKYFNMINSAHKSGNARLTILITHSPEIKDIVQQVINL